MKHILSLRTVLVIFLTAALAAISCKKDDSIIYGYQGIGTVSGADIILDNGIRAIVRNIQCDGSYVDCERVFILCDLLKKEDPSTYSINLRDWSRVLTKPFLTAGEVEDWDAIGDDPIDIISGWNGGKYLNLDLLFSFKADSETSHFLNLIYEDGESDADTLRFTLRHNSYGESYPHISEDDVRFGRAYASFPIADLIPEGQDAIGVNVTYKWHSSDAGHLIPETETHHLRGSIRR